MIEFLLFFSLFLNLAFIVVFYYIFQNVTKKIEAYEETIVQYQNELFDVYQKLKKLDREQVYASDDELGYFFKFLKSSITQIALKYGAEQKEERKQTDPETTKK